MTEEKQQTEYLPFNAINEFMRDDYRLAILSETFASFEKLTGEQRSRIGKFVSKFATIPGFRNANLAPVGRKAKACVPLFERSAEFAAEIVDSWVSLHGSLADIVYSLLIEKKWENLPEKDADHLQLPGFQIHWPKEDNFELLIKAVREKTPDLDESDDNISLMVVWLGNRLPYDLYAEDENNQD